MPNYLRIKEEERKDWRSIADALDVLRNDAGFETFHFARVWIGQLKLASGRVVSLVDVHFQPPLSDTIYCVSLPTSAHFKAIREDQKCPEECNIAILNNAIVSSDGRVTLTDGAVFRAIDVVPAVLPYDPTELDWLIVHRTVEVLGARRRCYRRWNKRWILDCHKVRKLKIPTLKVLAHQLAKRDRSLGKISVQKIADSLAMFGLRPLQGGSQPRF